MMEPILIITNLPDRASAMTLAHKLIDERLAACVNVLADCTSVYRWQGKTKQPRSAGALLKRLPSIMPGWSN